MAWGMKLSLCPAALYLIYRSLGEIHRRSVLRQHRVIGPWHFLSAWACGLFPEFAPRALQSPQLFPRMLEFASAEPNCTFKQLFEIRGKLTSIPTDSPGTIHFWHLASHSSPLANRHRECSDSVIEEYVHSVSNQKLARSVLEPELRDWALSIRPSVLTFRRGNVVYLEPYYPFRFSRNFGYDQHIPLSSADFDLSGRAIGGSHLMEQARKWWDFFHRFDTSTFRVPMPSHSPSDTRIHQVVECPNQACKTDCWDVAERKILQLQPQPALDIDREHLLCLKSGNQKAADQYLEARQSAKKKNPPPSLIMPEVAEDAFLATLQHLCNVSYDRLAVMQPWPVEEAAPAVVSQCGEADTTFPYRALSVRLEHTRSHYEYTSWLFVLLHAHNLAIEMNYEVILEQEFHVAFHYADGWGMDYLSLYYFLSSIGQSDLAIFAEDCCRINDVCWLVQEAASRAKQSAHTYWPLSRFYTGVADPSAKERRRRYHELIMKVKRPTYFADEKILFKPQIGKPPVRKSSMATNMARARKAPKRKREMSHSMPSYAEDPSIPSFEEFSSQRVRTAPSGSRWLLSFLFLLLSIHFTHSTWWAADDPPPATDIIGQDLPMPSATSSDVPSPPPVDAAADALVARAASKRPVTKAVARRAKRPPVLSSASLSDEGNFPKGWGKERISALDGIREDSASSVEKSPVVGSGANTAASPELVFVSPITQTLRCELFIDERLTDFEGDQEVGIPEFSMTAGVDHMTVGEIVSDHPSTSNVPSAIEGPIPEDRETLSLVLFGDSSSLPIQAPTTPLADAAIDTEVVVPEAATTSGTPNRTLGVSLASASFSSVELPSCSKEVDRSLWADVDAQVDFQAPTVASPRDISSPDVMAQQQLCALHLLVQQNPDIHYDKVKSIADQMTGVLVLMGCSLTDWANRVTLLFKLLKRRDYLQRELPDQLTAVEMQQSDCEAVGYDEESAILDSSISDLQAELDAAKARRSVLANFRAEQGLLLSQITAFYSTARVAVFCSTVEVTAFYSTVGGLLLSQIMAFYSTARVAAFYSTIEGLLLSQITAFYSTARVAAFYSTIEELLLSQITAFYSTARVAAFYSTVEGVRMMAQFTDALANVGCLSLLMFLRFATQLPV
ncbi:hypothetical protein Taro_037441 [Colocasia esculenta]|uniref:Aminotransferase-like plant mobile domain-containing protein n=1 Tax=Colocasia esculenta TaxID=4460 RepID=A0A843W9S0_COLES|nr:hypothetical protein [Colocasia esculenta]